MNVYREEDSLGKAGNLGGYPPDIGRPKPDSRNTGYLLDLTKNSE